MSAPYLRLKNSKRRQSLKYYFAVPESQVFFYCTEVGPSWHAERGLFRIFLTSIVFKYQKH